jgi:hypothetical protein
MGLLFPENINKMSQNLLINFALNKNGSLVAAVWAHFDLNKAATDKKRHFYF